MYTLLQISMIDTNYKLITVTVYTKTGHMQEESIFRYERLLVIVHFAHVSHYFALSKAIANFALYKVITIHPTNMD